MNIPCSERLSYRLLSADEHDAQLLFELDQDKEVMKYISGGVPTPMEDIINIFLPRLASYTNAEKGWGMWGCFSKSNDEYLGFILVRPMHFFSDAPEFNNIELGWRFKRHSWGKGIATEASSHLMQHLSQQEEIKKFSAIALKENQASIAIMKKLGMQFEKTDLHKDPLGDTVLDYYSYRL